MSKFTAVVSTAVVVVAGVGIFAGVASTFPTTCESPLEPGKASQLVTTSVTGDGVVEASFPTPLKTTGRELSVTREGTGTPAAAPGYVDFDVSAFVGSDGSFITASSYEKGNPVRREIVPAGDDFFSSVLECTLPGSQVVITTTVEDVFGPIDEDEVLQNTSTVVLVVDIHETYPHKATGSLRLPQSGMPTVVQTAEGVHGVSFPKAPIPTELRVSVLKQGDGPAIAEGDFVTAHFTGLVWNTQQVFSSSFERGIPLSLTAQDITESADGRGAIPGVVQALIGQTVGSQVLVSIPPSLGYPAGTAPIGVADGQTLVYIFDILGTTN
jgi:hypothetical protein